MPISEEFAARMLSHTDPDPSAAYPDTHERTDGGKLHIGLYLACMSGVPDETVRRIAHARNRVPADLRGLLLAVLAEPDDPASRAALADWLTENPPAGFGREVFIMNGGYAVGYAQPLPWSWWVKLSGLRYDVATALLDHFNPGADMSDRMSFAQVCSLTAADLLGLPNIGPARVRQLQKWLWGLGLDLNSKSPSPAPASS